MSTASNTASTAVPVTGNGTANKAFAEAHRVIAGDLWWPGACVVAAVALLVGGAMAQHVATVAHDRRIRAAAFSAGQLNGACRIWRGALSHDPRLAAGADGRSLDRQCIAILSGSLGQ